MPDLRRTICKRCGAHRDDVGGISWTGLCVPCALERVTENVVGLATMSGVPVKRWRRGVAASVGAVLLDDVTGDGQTPEP